MVLVSSAGTAVLTLPSFPMSLLLVLTIHDGTMARWLGGEGGGGESIHDRSDLRPGSVKRG